MKSLSRWFFKQSIPKQISLSFLSVMVLGSLLLSLPFSVLPDSRATYIDHLFTAVSSVAVTGLSLVTISETYTFIGQCIQLVLIEIGALGFISCLLYILFQFGKEVPLSARLSLAASLQFKHLGDLRQFLKIVLGYTLTLQLAGAGLLSLYFVPKFGLIGLFYSLYLAISAFCNAGFDNLGADSLQSYQHEPYVLFIIGMLIIISGLGFSVLHDIRQTFGQYRHFLYRGHIRFVWHKLSVHTRLVMSVTSVLLVIGAVSFILLSTATLPSAVFESVTLRTAGFTSVAYFELAPALIIVCCLLMAIGGSPGGSAGGIKTTTFSLMMLLLIAELKQHDAMTYAKRRIPFRLLKQAIVIVSAYSLVAFIGFWVLTLANPSVAPIRLLFETLSALSTVGISMSLTQELTAFSHVILMLLMFIGRVGPLTLLFSMLVKNKEKAIQYADTTLLIG